MKHLDALYGVRGPAGPLLILGSPPGPWGHLLGIFATTCCSAAVIAHVVLRHGSRGARALARWPVTSTGRANDGLCLYHYPGLMWLFAGGYAKEKVIWPVGPALTVVFTLARWWLIAQPANQQERRFAVVILQGHAPFGHKTRNLPLKAARSADDALLPNSTAAEGRG